MFRKHDAKAAVVPPPGLGLYLFGARLDVYVLLLRGLRATLAFIVTVRDLSPAPGTACITRFLILLTVTLLIIQLLSLMPGRDLFCGRLGDTLMQTTVASLGPPFDIGDPRHQACCSHPTLMCCWQPCSQQCAL